MGQSHERRDLHVMRLADAADKPQGKIFISCGQHAREWIAPASCMHMIDTITKTYQSNGRLRALLKKYELLIAPLMNPDGYEYSRTSYRYWRKNRRNNGMGMYGVDLNRNWPGKWGNVGTAGILFVFIPST